MALELAIRKAPPTPCTTRQPIIQTVGLRRDLRRRPRRLRVEEDLGCGGERGPVEDQLAARFHGARAFARRTEVHQDDVAAFNPHDVGRLHVAVNQPALVRLRERMAGLAQQVDRALERWGFAMGPFRVADVVGNDVSWLIRKRRYAERPDAPRQPIPDRLCELGRFGQKTGAGWYRYEPGRREAVPDPEVEALIAGVRRELGITPREIEDREVVERCVLALGNEGARILEEGIALRASDVDLVWLAGYGFPAHRGGPMYHLEELGLGEAVQALARYDRTVRGDPGAFTPAPLLVRRAAEGKPLDAAG